MSYGYTADHLIEVIAIGEGRFVLSQRDQDHNDPGGIDENALMGLWSQAALPELTNNACLSPMGIFTVFGSKSTFGMCTISAS